MINGVMVNVTDKALVAESEYKTNGESFIVIDSVAHCNLILDSKTTDDVTIKALTKVTVNGVSGEIKTKIDKQYDEIVMEAGSAITFSFNAGHWYITSSDGLKG